MSPLADESGFADSSTSATELAANDAGPSIRVTVDRTTPQRSQAERTVTAWAVLASVLHRHSRDGIFQLVQGAGDRVVAAGPYRDGIDDDSNEDRAAIAALACVAAVQDLAIALPRYGARFTAACVVGEAYGLLIGSGNRAFRMLGVGPQLAASIADAIPEPPTGACVAYCTAALANVCANGATCEGSEWSTGSFGPIQQWRMRDLPAQVELRAINLALAPTTSR